uniref:Cytochrome P450 52E2 n=1 Tax=Zeugodacus cucurbitae TaxID=28588 RepID=A0A0A1XFP0_ZEUCU
MLLVRRQELPSCLFIICLTSFCVKRVAEGLVAFPRGGSLGYLTAVAIPLDLPNKNVYVAFNFEANYGIPPNDSYYYWVDRWNIDKENVGVGNDVTPINNRRRRSIGQTYTRNAFYRSIVGYLDYYDMNGTGCLLRTICDVSASNLDEHNGLLGTLFKVLFMPTTSALENENTLDNMDTYAAEAHGLNGDCTQYGQWCPHGLLQLISEWF